ncbi:MAG: protein kinase domain-containing protein [Opitutales bacterium]
MNQELSDQDFLKAYTEASVDLGEFDQFRVSIDTQRYRNEKFVAEGGTKKIYKAYDSAGKRVVARAFPKLEESKHHDTFVREARLHAQLEHPNIIPIYDIGVEDAKPYFSMKFIVGGTLKTFIENAEVEASRMISENLNTAFDIFLKISDAVSYAHSKNILHLDLKPDNIYLNEYGEVYVGDWGLSRALDPEDYEESEVPNSLGQWSHYGHLIGTPGFMAPEQCVKGAEKGYYSDVYSLAVLLIQLLTGKMVVNGSPEEMIEQTVNGDLIDLNGLLDDRLLGVLKKALSTDPTDRYQSVKDLLTDINAYRNGFFTSTEQFSVLKLISAIYNRNKVTSNLVLGFAAIIFALSIFFVVEITQARDYAFAQEEISKDRLAQYLESEVQRSKVITNAYNFLLSEGIENYERRRPGSGFSSENFSDALNMAEIALKFDPSSSEAWALKAKIYMVEGLFSEAHAAFSRAGPGYEKYMEICTFADSKDTRKLPDLVDVLIKLRTLNDNRLFNHIMFREMYRQRPPHKQVELVREFLILRNKSNISINFRFDKDRMALDLSGSTELEILYPLQILPLRELNLANTGVRHGDFLHIQNMPLTHLDVSNTVFDNARMRILEKKPLHTLSLENCSVSDLRALKETPLKHLNIAGTPVQNFKPLKSVEQLETIVCSPSQLPKIKSVLPANQNIQFVIRN